MSEKLSSALTNLEKARETALAAAIGDRAYRLCVVLDADGQVQKAINRARRMLAPRVEKKTSKK
jgi:hypothetical protein